jgi:hypothetical protein
MKYTKNFDAFYSQFDVDSITLPTGENADMRWIETSSSEGSRGQTFKINIHEARGCVFRS